jgi:hypothetical protein
MTAFDAMTLTAGFTAAQAIADGASGPAGHGRSQSLVLPVALARWRSRSWPRAIRGRGDHRQKEETHYLQRCWEVPRESIDLTKIRPLEKPRGPARSIIWCDLLVSRWRDEDGGAPSARSVSPRT